MTTFSAFAIIPDGCQRKCRIGILFYVKLTLYGLCPRCAFLKAGRNIMYDLVIVGAGPAGIFTVLQLLKRGLKSKIAIIEQVNL